MIIKTYLKVTFGLLLVLMAIISCQKSEPYEDASVENKVLISHEPEPIWTYISNLGNLQELLPSVIATSNADGIGLGSIVSIDLKNNAGFIKEKVIAFDQKSYEIRYTMIETPMPIKEYIGQFNVVKVNDQISEVYFKTTFKVQQKNREQRLKAFNSLQIELLSNLKNKYNE